MAASSEIGLENPRACSGCTLCCKVFNLPILNKEAGAWCEHCTQGKGCGIYSARPAPCRTFQCMWTVAGALGEEWRPDNAGFVIAADGMLISIVVDPETPDAWREQPYYAQLKRWSVRNRPNYLTVIVRTPKQSIVIFPETDIALGPARKGFEIRSGYRNENGRAVPFAHFEAAPVAGS